MLLVVLCCYAWTKMCNKAVVRQGRYYYQQVLLYPCNFTNQKTYLERQLCQTKVVEIPPNFTKILCTSSWNLVWGYFMGIKNNVGWEKSNITWKSWKIPSCSVDAMNFEKAAAKRQTSKVPGLVYRSRLSVYPLLLKLSVYKKWGGDVFWP